MGSLPFIGIVDPDALTTKKANLKLRKDGSYALPVDAPTTQVAANVVRGSRWPKAWPLVTSQNDEMGYQFMCPPQNRLRPIWDSTLKAWVTFGYSSNLSNGASGFPVALFPYENGRRELLSPGSISYGIGPIYVGGKYYFMDANSAYWYELNLTTRSWQRVTASTPGGWSSQSSAIFYDFWIDVPNTRIHLISGTAVLVWNYNTKAWVSYTAITNATAGSFSPCRSSDGVIVWFNSSENKLKKYTPNTGVADFHANVSSGFVNYTQLGWLNGTLCSAKMNSVSVSRGIYVWNSGTGAFDLLGTTDVVFNNSLDFSDLSGSPAGIYYMGVEDGQKMVFITKGTQVASQYIHHAYRVDGSGNVEHLMSWNYNIPTMTNYREQDTYHIFKWFPAGTVFTNSGVGVFFPNFFSGATTVPYRVIGTDSFPEPLTNVGSDGTPSTTISGTPSVSVSSLPALSAGSNKIGDVGLSLTTAVDVKSLAQIAMRELRLIGISPDDGLTFTPAQDVQAHAWSVGFEYKGFRFGAQPYLTAAETQDHSFWAGEHMSIIKENLANGAVTELLAADSAPGTYGGECYPLAFNAADESFLLYHGGTNEIFYVKLTTSTVTKIGTQGASTFGYKNCTILDDGTVIGNGSGTWRKWTTGGGLVALTGYGSLGVGYLAVGGGKILNHQGNSSVVQTLAAGVADNPTITSWNGVNFGHMGYNPWSYFPSIGRFVGLAQGNSVWNGWANGNIGIVEVDATNGLGWAQKRTVLTFDNGRGLIGGPSRTSASVDYYLTCPGRVGNWLLFGWNDSAVSKIVLAAYHVLTKQIKMIRQEELGTELSMTNATSLPFTPLNLQGTKAALSLASGSNVRLIVSSEPDAYCVMNQNIATANNATSRMETYPKASEVLIVSDYAVSVQPQVVLNGHTFDYGSAISVTGGTPKQWFDANLVGQVQFKVSNSSGSTAAVVIYTRRPMR